MSAAPVVIVGAGPAGLSAAIELRRRGVSDVVVLEREREAGGIPRHAGHQGFGLRDLRRLMSGPRYAGRLTELALRAGVELHTETMVTGWSSGGSLELTSPRGRETLVPAAVVLATGCRERPRSARLVPGARPAGVMTTGTLQQLVYLRRGERTPVGSKAVVVGAEHVSFSALLTLAHGGARTVGMVTDLRRHQSLAAFRAGAGLRFRAPLLTRTAVSAINGHPRVEEVELTDLDSGRTRTLTCDTVVFTADWVPDNELAIMAGIEIDPGTRGPAVDSALRSSRPGVFAAGNVLHGAETADVAALSGRHAAAGVAAFLAEGGAGAPEPGGAPAAEAADRSARVRIVCAEPLGWIAPNVVAADAGEPARGRYALRARDFLTRPELDITQGGRVLWSGRVRRLIPGRSTRLSCGWESAVEPGGETVEIRLAR